MKRLWKPESTVVAEYTPEIRTSDSYQSEAALEAAFIKLLTEQGYEYVTIHNESDLIENLRRQLERLNQFSFTDAEWERFFKDKIANQNEGIVEKTRKIQEDHVQNLIREDGTTMNIALIDNLQNHCHHHSEAGCVHHQEPPAPRPGQAHRSGL